MNKSILISIRPEHAVKILNGDKTLELRKSVPKDFTGWVYIYCTKGKQTLSVVHDDENGKTYYYLNSNWGRKLNGEIVARFWFDKYDAITYEDFYDHHEYMANDGEVGWEVDSPYIYSLQIEYDEVDNYLLGKTGYAWHIKKLEIFNKPKDLWDFHTRHDMLDGLYFERKAYQFEYVKKAPKNWQYVYKEE